jgi:hypothetical protein
MIAPRSTNVRSPERLDQPYNRGVDMKVFLVKLVFFYICIGAHLALSENNCRVAFSPLTQYAPYEIGARPSDLNIAIAQIESEVIKAEENTLSTSDRLAIVYAKAWIDAARKFTSEREKEDLPNLNGGVFLGLSRFGEASLRDDLAPFAFELNPTVERVINISSLDLGENISEETARKMVSIFQNQGSDSLRNFVKTQTRSLSDREMNGITDAAEKVFIQTIEQSLNQLSDREDIREAYRDSRSEIIELFRRSENEIRSEFETVEKQILSTPEFKVRSAEVGSIEQILASDIANLNPAEAFDPLRANEEIPTELNQVILEFLSATNFKETFTENEGREPSLFDTMIEMLNDTNYRRQLRSAAVTQLTRQESAYLSAVAEQKDRLPQVDILFIGAGLHEQNMQNYLRLNAKDLKTVTIERAEIPGSTFAVGGKAFNLNSSSKAEDPTSLRQKLGESDLNFLPGGIAQVNQFSREKNPPAEYFADAIIINRGFSNNPILFNREVTAVQKEADLYLVTLSDGLQIYAKSIVQTGIGKPSIPESIQGLKDAYQEGLKQANATTPSPIMTYPDFMRFVNSTSKPLTPFANKKVAVVGAGDSGKAIVRWLSIQSNPDSYARDTRRVSQPESIFWYGQVCNTCAEFVNENRSFYADLVGGFKSGRTISKDKLSSVERTPDGRYLLKTVEGSSDIAERVSEEIVDFIIVTTGFENPIRNLYGEIIGPSEVMNNLSPMQFVEQSPNLRLIRGIEPSLGLVGLARQVVSQDQVPEDIYLVGPLAGRVVDPRELKDIEENYVANANHNWRAWRLIEALAVKLLKPLE